MRSGRRRLRRGLALVLHGRRGRRAMRRQRCGWRHRRDLRLVMHRRGRRRDMLHRRHRAVMTAAASHHLGCPVRGMLRVVRRRWCRRRVNLLLRLRVRILRLWLLNRRQRRRGWLCVWRIRRLLRRLL
jgi:hypothetical protein